MVKYKQNPRGLKCRLCRSSASMCWFLQGSADISLVSQLMEKLQSWALPLCCSYSKEMLLILISFVLVPGRSQIGSRCFPLSASPSLVSSIIGFYLQNLTNKQEGGLHSFSSTWWIKSSTVGLKLKNIA